MVNLGDCHLYILQFILDLIYFVQRNLFLLLERLSTVQVKKNYRTELKIIVLTHFLRELYKIFSQLFCRHYLLKLGESVKINLTLEHLRQKNKKHF